MKNSADNGLSYKNWMSHIPDETNISKLNIPGTHNSGAFFKLSPPSVRCQGGSIDHQLKNGIRFLDIRLSKDYMSRGEKVEELMIVRGKFPVKLSGSYKFRKALDEIYSFLEKNPTETILVSIKFENTMLNFNKATDEFAKLLFQKYIGHNRDRWYLSDQIPTLKYCRGKAILLRRFPVIENGTYKKFGIPSNWNYSSLTYEDSHICVQDCYEIKSTDDLNKKVKLIKNMITKASDYNVNNNINSTTSMKMTINNNENLIGGSDSSTNSNVSSLSSFPNSSNSLNSTKVSYKQNNDSNSDLPPKLFINFCTGSSVLQKQFWPSNVNKLIQKYNIENYFVKQCGILVFDFADRDDWSSVKKLIGFNFS